MFRTRLYNVAIAAVFALMFGIPALAEEAEPDHIRGQITKADASSIAVRTSDGKTVRIGLSDSVTIVSLTKGSFTAVDFGTYVGSVAVKLDELSPIVRAIPRDSLSFLHEARELRVIDEQLRGIALGYKKWDVPMEGTISHGWVDDIENRVLSIKYGPTEEEETDVLIPREAPVLKMSLGDRGLIQPGVHIFAGAQKGADGKYVAVFVFVGQDGIVPPL